jgi:hypothetical protein
MKRHPKKLTLSRESIRILTIREHAEVHGGRLCSSPSQTVPVTASRTEPCV